jgi:hypothetical protein
MKTQIAMAISIAGVLVAGSAAALVNTQVLGGNAAATPVLAESVQQTVPTDPTTVTVAPVVTTPATLPVATTPTVPAQPATVAATQAAYTVSDAGTVTLDTAGDALTIVNVAVAPGWTVTKSENEDPKNVEVKFQNGSVEVEFHANMQFGVVTPSVERKDDSATSNSVDNNGGGGRHGGDDDSDDDHGGDDD